MDKQNKIAQAKERKQVAQAVEQPKSKGPLPAFKLPKSAMLLEKPAYEYSEFKQASLDVGAMAVHRATGDTALVQRLQCSRDLRHCVSEILGTDGVPISSPWAGLVLTLTGLAGSHYAQRYLQVEPPVAAQ